MLTMAPDPFIIDNVLVFILNISVKFLNMFHCLYIDTMFHVIGLHIEKCVFELFELFL